MEIKKVSEVYENLYHYTTWEGLKGILESQSLWATNYKYLNDYSEIIHFKDKLISLITPSVRDSYQILLAKNPEIADEVTKHGGIDIVVAQDAEAVVDSQYKALGNEIYILSFCGEHKEPRVNENGLLSQWRGYGVDGGAALVLDTKQLEDNIGIEVSQYEYGGMLLADVIYSDNEQKFKDELANDISILTNIAERFFDYEFLKGKYADFSDGFYPFINCVSRYKHCGFSEENEVRVVAVRSTINKKIQILAKQKGRTLKSEKEVKTRINSEIEVPYIELFDSKDTQLPIKRIIVGPHRDKEDRADKLKQILMDKDIEILCSDIPFAT